jgi:hypothetical protein
MRLAAAKPVLASAAQTVQRDLLPQVPVSGGGPRPAGYAVVSGFVGFQPQSHLPTVAVLGILIVVLLALYVSSVQVRRMEINYTAE